MAASQIWWKVVMPYEESDVGGKAHVLREEFAKVFSVNVGPAHAAMFWGRDESRERYFCYFSPEAVHLARNLIEPYGPIPCGAPRRGTVHLAVGHAGIDETLLQEPEGEKGEVASSD
jgi:hypothetical protein